MIPGGSNFGIEDGTCMTPGSIAQATVDRSALSLIYDIEYD